MRQNGNPDFMFNADYLYWVSSADQTKYEDIPPVGFYCEYCIEKHDLLNEDFPLTLMRILTELHMLKGVPDEMRPFQITEYQIQETPEANFVIQRLDSQSDTWDWQIQWKTPEDENLTSFDIESKGGYDSPESAQTAMIDWFTNFVTQREKAQ